VKKLLYFALALISALAPCLAQAQNPTPVITVPNPPNTPAQQSKHYVVLVSLDGFRYDYPTKYGAPHLLSMAAKGASAPNGMLPSYPSLTFPNHLALVTGLYPEHHGIVGNSFYDPSRDATYVYTQSKTNSDGTWYSGTPLWVLAEQQGVRAACLFWPGSEAEIQGKRPSYYLHFDDKVDDEKRTDQIVAWLQLPPELRPHFITLYYANVDHAGHTYGPESDEVRAAVHHLDDMIGELQTKLATLHLPIDLVVVADHGMVTLKPDTVVLSDFADLTNFRTEGSLLYANTDADAAKAYAEFTAHSDPRFTAYRRADVPAALHFDTNPREGDPVIVPNGPYNIRATAPKAGSTIQPGGHGFDPHTMPEMKAIFFAEGPDIKPAVKLAPFENVNVYPFIAHILDLRAPIVDGKLGVLANASATVPIIVRIQQGSVARPAKLAPISSDEPVKLGIGVTPPKPIHTAPPEYTEEARKAGIQGTVLLSIRIEKDGRPSRIIVLKGLGMGLDAKAVMAARQSTFEPALKDGQPVVVEIRYEMNFQVF
jgi:TonB family protein